jgi:hypothetical protein
VPADATEVQQRVMQLQRLLGDAGAARAIQRWPGILGSRCGADYGLIHQ